MFISGDGTGSPLPPGDVLALVEVVLGLVEVEGIPTGDKTVGNVSNGNLSIDGNSSSNISGNGTAGVNVGHGGSGHRRKRKVQRGGKDSRGSFKDFSPDKEIEGRKDFVFSGGMERLVEELDALPNSLSSGANDSPTEAQLLEALKRARSEAVEEAEAEAVAPEAEATEAGVEMQSADVMGNVLPMRSALKKKKGQVV